MMITVSSIYVNILKQPIDAVDKDGVELMGYTPWGIIDIVSFTTGEMKNAMV